MSWKSFLIKYVKSKGWLAQHPWLVAESITPWHYTWRGPLQAFKAQLRYSKSEKKTHIVPLILEHLAQFLLNDKKIGQNYNKGLPFSQLVQWNDIGDWVPCRWKKERFHASTPTLVLKFSQLLILLCAGLALRM